ncbi:MAG: PRC-barrel domain-containing protein [Verrucomicrobiota bacterium]
MKIKSNYSFVSLAATGKTLKTLAWIFALGTLPMAAPAAEPATHDDFRAIQQSVELIGLEVKDSQNQPLGKIKDLALDLENGRIVEVIVASGGFLGWGQRIVAVPPGAFEFDVAGETVSLNVSKAKFQAATAFSLSKWEEHCQSPRVAAAYRYFGQEPYFAADGKNSQTGNTATEPLGYFQRSSELIGLPVNNASDKRLGTVNAFMFDLRQGYVIHTVVQASGVFPTKSIIQTRALRFNATHDALCLDISTQAFRDRPRFQWTENPGSGDFKQEAYVNRKVAANLGTNTKQNVDEGIVSSYIPLAQGTSFRDVDKTHRIYSAMQADASLSKNAQNVEVGTLNGRTTLRGHVNSEAGKRAIGDIAEQAGKPENVSNLLEVRPVPLTYNAN